MHSKNKNDVITYSNPEPRTSLPSVEKLVPVSESDSISVKLLRPFLEINFDSFKKAKLMPLGVCLSFRVPDCVVKKNNDCGD